MIIHPIEHPFKIAHMVNNLMGAQRKRRQRKDGDFFTAKATEFAGWLEEKHA